MKAAAFEAQDEQDRRTPPQKSHRLKAVLLEV
jgi:hypothetical protein